MANDFFLECEKYYSTTQGYTSIVRLPVDEKISALIGEAKAKTDGVINPSSMTSNMLTSVGLLAKEKKLYALPVRLAKNFTASNYPAELAPVPDGVHIFVIVLTEKSDKQRELQLRVMQKRDSGHPGLLLQGEDGSTIVAAGEFYTENSKIVLANDKSGQYNRDREKKRPHQKEITDLFFKDYYKPGHGYFPATKDDGTTNNKLRELGYEHLIPEKFKTSTNKGKPSQGNTNLTLGRENLFKPDNLTFFGLRYKGFVESFLNACYSIKKPS